MTTSKLPPTTIDATAIEGAAAQLRGAMESRTPIAPLRDRFTNDGSNLGPGIEHAYAVQRVNVEHALAAGATIVGRKIGLTSSAVQRQLGVDRPDFGTLLDNMIHCDDEEIPVSRLLQPRVEAELALVLGKSLDADRITLTDVISAVAYALAAIEVVDSRVKDWDINIIDTVADNASSGVVVLGNSPVPLAAIDTRLCGMVMERAGDQVSIGLGAACLGNPINAALWLARTLAAAGDPLRAGDVILTGALGPMVPANPTDVFTARISGLGSVRARFSK